MASQKRAGGKTGEAEMERVGCSGGDLAPAAGRRASAANKGAAATLLPPTPDRDGRTAARRLRGEAPPLVIDMEAARRAVKGFLVVGRLLSPFQVNPRVIIDDLRSSAWKLQGEVTVQEVASVDGRFVLNFAAEGDRHFVLKAQPWHHKRDGIIFAEIDGKGDPAEVDLGVMTIWAQVRDLPFELKIESMGWTLGDQLGVVKAVSHHNHVIVEKFLRVRLEILPFELKTESMGWTLGDQLGVVKAVSHHNHVIVEKFLGVRLEILLHEPIKSTVEFTPLGSSETLKFDVKYEKLPLYCECCGLVGHTSERFCNIPSEKRIAMYPKNLSVDAYWKGQSSNRRAIIFGSLPRDNKINTFGADNNNTSMGMEGAVVKVAKAVSGLTVSDKGITATSMGAVQACPPLGQEGRAAGAPSKTRFSASSGQEDRVVAPSVPASFGQEGRAAGDPLMAHLGATSGQEDRVVKPSAPASFGQEGQGLAGRTEIHMGVMQGQEGYAMQRLGAPGGASLAAGVAGYQHHGHGKALLDMPSNFSVGAAATAKQLSPAPGIQEGALLFQPGVLEALSGAVAARLAASASAAGSAKENKYFEFCAGKTIMQGHSKIKGRKEKKGGVAGRSEVREEVIGKKRRHATHSRPTGSDILFSFEKHMDSYERILYEGMDVSSKRICTGRVETVKGVDGVVTHVAKEMDDKEEEYVQKDRESVGKERKEVDASAASEEEDRRVK